MRSQSKQKIPACSANIAKVSAEGMENRTETNPNGDPTRRDKDILYWRHKLQKGLLIEGEKPKEEDMKQMSHYLRQLERFPHLEKESIRGTKVNKALKSILSIKEIPGEDEFCIKSRSKSLLEQWETTLRGDEPSKDATVGTSGNSYMRQSAELIEKPEVYETKHDKESDNVIPEADMVKAVVDSDDAYSEATNLLSDDEDDTRWAEELAAMMMRNKAAQEERMAKASIILSQPEVINLSSDDEGDMALAKPVSQSKNRTVIQDDLIKTPTTLKRRRPRNANQGSSSNNTSPTHPRKSRRISSLVQKTRNEESSGMNDIGTANKELIQLIEESAIGFGKIAANLEKIATSLKNRPGW